MTVEDGRPLTGSALLVLQGPSCDTWVVLTARTAQTPHERVVRSDLMSLAGIVDDIADKCHGRTNYGFVAGRSCGLDTDCMTDSQVPRVAKEVVYGKP